MSEEDQMMRAIAMSLGQDIPMDQRAESPEVGGRLGGDTEMGDDDTGFTMGAPHPPPSFVPLAPHFQPSRPVFQPLSLS